MLEMKLALVELLHTFTFLPSDKNPETLVLGKKSIIQQTMSAKTDRGGGLCSVC